MTAERAPSELAKLGKTQRQHLVAKLLEDQAVSSQAQLVELLAAEGVAATQATVSPRPRGARRHQGAHARAARPPTPSPSCPRSSVAPEDHLRRVFGDWVVEVAHSDNLVVLRTPPGSAHVVGSALDRSGLPERARHRRRRRHDPRGRGVRASAARPWPQRLADLAGL